MSTEPNKSVLLRWIDAMNKKDVTVLEKLADELFTVDFVNHDPSFPDMEPGPAGVKKFVHWVLKGSPDIQITVHDMMADGDKVISRFTLNFTDATTREPVSLLVIGIDRFVGGQIAEEWELGVPGKW